jgi:hypothetical protein
MESHMVTKLAEIKPDLETATDTSPASFAPDPFDLDNLRLDQSFAETAGVKKLLHTVPGGGRTRKIS